MNHDLSAEGAAAHVERLARTALTHYDIPDGATTELINISENATFLVEPPDGDRLVLRIHRRNYHDAGQIYSELAWLDALRADAGVRTPFVIETREGHRLLTLEEDVAPRHVVMFEWLPGREPAKENLVAEFTQLGEITACMHEHSRRWRKPPGFDRFAWDYDGAFGTGARWGRWQRGIAVGAAERDILGRLDHTIRGHLERFGQTLDNYGLIHADLRLANLLVRERDTFVIDFDDCGWGWLLYDLGAALSFIEDDPRVPELVDSWVAGYRRVRELSEEHAAEIPTFIMMRRLLLVAWIGSHANTDLARSFGADYTRVSCDLAEEYLKKHALS
jgi:Ser/Thr protein kinase RdoA (MazF antagonist)